MISRSVGGLMDAAPEPAVMERIKELVANSAAGRDRGARFAHPACREADLPGFPSGGSGQHDGCGGARDLRSHRGALKAEMGHLMITIHVEPEEKAKPGSVAVVPRV